MKAINIKKYLEKNSGQILAEILIAIVIGGIFITGATISLVLMIRQNFENRGNQTASSINYNLLDNVINLARSNWNNLYGLDKGSQHHYFLVRNSTSSIAVEGDKSFLFNDVSAGIVGHWGFDESSSTIAYDYSGNFLNGNKINSPITLASSSCRVGNCLNFDGVSDYIDIGNPEKLQITGDQTIIMWLKPDNLSVRRNLYSKAYGGEGTITQETNGFLNYYYGTTGGNATPYQTFSTGVSVVTVGRWTFISLIRDLTNMKLYWYVNGKFLTSTNANYSSAATSSLSVFIGGGDLSNYAGSIDDVRIYNRALSADEISALYNSFVYYKYFYVENVLRDLDGTGSIVGSGGAGISEDKSTQKLNSVVYWIGGRDIKYSTYITRHNDNVFVQNNWTGGPNSIGPTKYATTKFATSTNIDYSDRLVLLSSTSSGILESVIFDTGAVDGAAINSIRWNGSLPSGAHVKFQIAYSNNSSGPWIYVGDDGSSNTYFEPASEGVSDLTNIFGYRYFRYKVFLIPEFELSLSPTVNDIIINFSR